MRVYEGSLWSETWTCFPEAQGILRAHLPARQWRVLILGCGDGKHTLPFLAAGHRVLALDDDPVVVEGGRFEFLGQSLLMHPILENVAREGLERDLLRLELTDYMRYETDERFDVVLTSCSWQFRRNWVHPIASILRRIQAWVAPGGFLVADYMQPHEARRRGVEHYLTLEQMSRHFSGPWRLHLHSDEGIVRERHIRGEHWHEHRYASLVAQRHEGASP